MKLTRSTRSPSNSPKPPTTPYPRTPLSLPTPNSFLSFWLWGTSPTGTPWSPSSTSRTRHWDTEMDCKKVSLIILRWYDTEEERWIKSPSMSVFLFLFQADFPWNKRRPRLNNWPIDTGSTSLSSQTSRGFTARTCSWSELCSGIHTREARQDPGNFNCKLYQPNADGNCKMIIIEDEAQILPAFLIKESDGNSEQW